MIDNKSFVWRDVAGFRHAGAGNGFEFILIIVFGDRSQNALSTQRRNTKRSVCVGRKHLFVSHRGHGGIESLVIGSVGVVDVRVVSDETWNGFARVGFSDLSGRPDAASEFDFELNRFQTADHRNAMLAAKVRLIARWVDFDLDRATGLLGVTGDAGKDVATIGVAGRRKKSVDDQQVTGKLIETDACSADGLTGFAILHDILERSVRVPPTT